MCLSVQADALEIQAGVKRRPADEIRGNVAVDRGVLNRDRLIGGVAHTKNLEAASYARRISDVY